MSGQWFFALVSIFLSIIPAIIYLVAAWLILRDVPVTAGTVVAFTTVQARLMWPLMGLLRIALDLQTSRALFARIFEYLDLVPAITDAPDARPVDRARLGEVAFENVTFRYPDMADDAPGTLRGVSFAIEPGQYAAFVGPSGAGKTTVSYLVPRLYDVADGRVVFAGRRRARAASASRSSTRSASSARRPTSSTRRSPRTSATPSRTRPTRSCARRRGPPTSTTRSRRSPTATTRSSANAATG